MHTTLATNRGVIGGLLLLAALGACVMTMWPLGALVAHVGLGVVSIVLSVIDVREHRLPNKIVIPALAGSALALGVETAHTGDTGRLMIALLGAALLFTGYLGVALVLPGTMGFGDVKLAALLGLFLGWHGWNAFLLGAGAPFVLGGVWAAFLLASRRANRRTAVPFGPWMILGTWVGICVGALPTGV